MVHPESISLNREQQLRRRIKLWLTVFIVGLVLSGLSAFPIESGVKLISDWLGVDQVDSAENLRGLKAWIVTVRNAVIDTNARYPFLAYGTDWLGFAHLIIAIVFVGPLRDPVRNQWVVTFGIIACLAVIPMALIAGPIRGIPFFWQLIDCSFGLIGLVPLLIVRRAISKLEGLESQAN